MRWNDLLQPDVGALPRGGVRATSPQPWRRLLDLRRVSRGPRPLGGRRALIPRVTKAADLLTVTDQLRRVAVWNAPLPPALEAMSLDAPNRRVRRVFISLGEAINQGHSLAEAMRKQKRFFPQDYCDLIEAGERTGVLGKTLSDLTNRIDEGLSFRADLQGLIAQPVLVFVTSVSVIGFIVTRVTPVLVEILHDAGGEVPASLTWASTILGRFVDPKRGALGFPAVLAATVLVVLLLRRARHWAIRGRLLPHLPYMRNLFARLNLLHISRVLAMLLRAGYPVNEALSSAARTSISPVYSALLERMRKRIEAGATLAQAAQGEGSLLPKSFRAILSLGESSGRLPEGLERVALLYERHLLKVGRVAAQISQPCFTIGLGCVVFWLYFAVFSAMIGIMDGLMAGM